MEQQTHNQFLPSFGIAGYQFPVTLLTVLAIGMSGRDCKAYRGIVSGTSPTADQIDEVRRGGDKVSETEAREMFDLGDLRYRK